MRRIGGVGLCDGLHDDGFHASERFTNRVRGSEVLMLRPAGLFGCESNSTPIGRIPPAYDRVSVWQDRPDP